jgi:hypothetical protein
VSITESEGRGQRKTMLYILGRYSTGLTKAKIMLLDKKLLKYIVKPNLSWHLITCTLNIMLSKISIKNIAIPR